MPLLLPPASKKRRSGFTRSVSLKADLQQPNILDKKKPPYIGRLVTDLKANLINDKLFLLHLHGA